MYNDYEFWNDYLKKIYKQIEKLCNEKKELHIDMHIHSNYSADGKQTIKQIIDSTSKLGFDIISITDHDTIDAYDEIYDYVKKDITTPIIIPGLEFTIDNKEYGNQCHILQFFVNPKDKNILEKIKINYNASFNRSKIQFRRLKENKAMQEIMNQNQINISYEEYINYLKKTNGLPEYDTLANYLIENLKNKNINNFDILKKLEYYNNQDCYQERKQLKFNRYKELKEKYHKDEKQNYNPHFLMSMLAVKKVDDDWWPPPSSGSLSVNSYGQLKVEELDKSVLTIFAHPTENKLDVVDKIIDNNKYIIGLEQNIRNEYKNIDNFTNILKKHNICKVIGSDDHGQELYSNMDYFKIDSQDFIKILKGVSYGKD